jgi:hypothetical protein
MYKMQRIVTAISIGLISFSTIPAQNIPEMMDALEKHILENRPAPLRDIITSNDVNVRDYGAIPDDDKDDYSSIVSAINAAKQKTGGVKIIFESGRYLVTPPNGNAAIVISSMNNVVVEGNNAEIIIKRQAAGFSYVSSSTNVILRNFSIDYDPLPFAECIIQSVNKTQGILTVKVDPGFPVLNASIFKDYSGFGLVKDPAFPGKLKDNTPNFLSIKSVTETGDRIYSIELNKAQDANQIAVNDRYTHVFRPGEAASSGRVRNSTNVTFENLKIFASPSLVYGSFLSTNISILSCTTQVKDGRYTVANADGLHVQANRVGPWVENSEFTGLADDGVNIYSTPIFATSIPGSMQCEMYSTTGIRINDIISFWRPSTGEILAELKVVNTAGKLLFFDKPLPALNLPPAGTTFDSKTWAQKYDHAYNTSNIGNNFVFRNNYFHDSRRFGIYIKASNGIIENNRIIRLSNSGIRVNNEPSWPEGFYSKNLVIKNNTIEDCMKESASVPTDNAQVNIAFHGGSRRNQKYIYIHNNTFRSPKTPAIRFGNAHDVYVTNNTVTGQYTGNYLQLSNTCNVIASGNSGIADARIACTDVPFYTAIENPQLNTNVLIYPNPTSDTFKITNTDESVKCIQLFTQNGQLLKTISTNPEELHCVDTLPNGIYFIKISGIQTITYSKLIVQR